MADAPKKANDPLTRLRKLLGRGRRGWSSADLLDLPRLYRAACSEAARLESQGLDPRRAARARDLVGRAHAVLYRDVEDERQPFFTRLHRFFLVECPRELRAQWRLLTFTFASFYGLAILSFLAVRHDLDLAPTLLDPGMVESEISQLQATEEGEPFKGNFTFGFGESPGTAGWIMLHNMGVGVMFFGAALIPPVYAYIMATNGLMVGTYTAVAGHWGQAGAISSILWCHGALELQAIVLAGTAGLMIFMALVLPGTRTRGHALVVTSRRALRVLAPVFPMLFVAGLIEGFVSPHAPFGARLAVAVGTGLLFLLWLLFSGRGEEPEDGRPQPA